MSFVWDELGGVAGIVMELGTSDVEGLMGVDS